MIGCPFARLQGDLAMKSPIRKQSFGAHLLGLTIALAIVAVFGAIVPVQAAGRPAFLLLPRMSAFSGCASSE
jgi:hypothetical protein